MSETNAKNAKTIVAAINCFNLILEKIKAESSGDGEIPTITRQSGSLKVEPLLLAWPRFDNCVDRISYNLREREPVPQDLIVETATRAIIMYILQVQEEEFHELFKEYEKRNNELFKESERRSHERGC